MTRITLILFLFTIYYNQNLDIGKMSNSDLDKLRDSLKEEQELELDNLIILNHLKT